MDESPVISVIMGIYNCAETLPRAVECIQNQTFSDWELIMCDDGSSDDTYEAALELAKNDSRLVVIRNDKNMSLAPTLNKCLSYARGKYIARMDGDDLCSPERFEKELRVLLDDPDIAFVSCDMDLSDKDGVFRVVNHPERPTARDLIDRSMFCHAAVLIKTDVIKSVGAYSESPKRKRVEDYDLWVRLYAKGYKGFNIQESLYTMIDERTAYRRRSFSNRVNECRVKYRACKSAKVSLFYYFNCLIPLIKWMTPYRLYLIIHKKKGSNTE